MAIPREDISIVRILASTIVVCILASTSLVLSFISFTSCIRYGFTSTHGVRSNSADAGPVRCLSPHGASNVRYRETEERYRCIGGAIGDVVAEWRFSAFVRRSVFESTDTTNVLKEGRMGQISTNHGGLPSIPFPCSRGGLALASSIEQRGRYAECIGAPRRSPLAFLRNIFLIFFCLSAALFFLLTGQMVEGYR